MSYRTLIMAVAAIACLAAAAVRPDEKPPRKFARFVGTSGQPVYGFVEGRSLREISGVPFGEWKKTERLVPLTTASFLAVTDARNVYALAGNYEDHLVGLR